VAGELDYTFPATGSDVGAIGPIDGRIDGKRVPRMVA
jgi:hypothetical protein